MPSIGPLELAIVLLIVLVIFGPKRLPGLGRQLGAGMREFKDSLTGKDKDDDSGEEPAVRQQTLDRTAAEPEVVTGEARPQDQPASRAD
jgi:sec-independent protein translocase protein TatA